LFLIARTDARAVNGLDDALRRAERYVRAGADGIFVEAPQSEAELLQIARAVDVPQMCNMLVGGMTPILSNRELHDMGFKIIVHGTTLIKRVAKVLNDTLRHIKDDELSGLEDDFVHLDEFVDACGIGAWMEIEQTFTPNS